MSDSPTSWMAPHLEAFATGSGRGLRARQPIEEGELLVLWGGRIVPREAFATVDRCLRSLSLQVEEELFLVPARLGPADRVNHSCSPNAGLSGQVALVAMRDISRGEQICYDYAMSDGSPYDEFECLCGAEACRGEITGDDWRLPFLQERYEGFFSPYLERRIRQLRIAAVRRTGSR